MKIETLVKIICLVGETLLEISLKFKFYRENKNQYFDNKTSLLP